jgi:hypothetical protein
MSGGGGGGQTSSTVTQSNLPEYAEPYFTNMMARAEIASQRPYVPYTGQIQANQSPDTLAAQQQVREMQGAYQPYMQAATDTLGFTGDVASRMAAYQAPDIASRYQAPAAYSPSQYQSSYQAPSVYAPGQFQSQFQAGAGYAPGQFYTQNITPQEVTTQDFTGANLQQYMSPYMQNVIENQKRAAVQAFQEGQASRDEGAIRSGAFGGYRNAIERGVAERGLEKNLSDIEGAGQQAAYQQAMAQFNADQARQLQAASTTAGLGLTAQQANLQALMQAQQAAEQSRQYGGTLGFQEAQYANQAQLAAAQQAEQARQYYAQLMQQQAQFGSQADLAAAQMREQSGQYGATLGSQQGMFGAQQDLNAQIAAAQAAQQAANLWGQSGALGLQGSQLYGSLGGLQQQLGLAGTQALGTIGSQQQAYEQQALDIARQSFENQRDYEKQMLQFYGALLRGVPVSPSSNITQYQATSPMAQMAGLGLTGLGMYNMLGKMA